MSMHLDSVRFSHERFPSKEHYPFTLQIFQKTEQIQFDSPVTFFVGENGTGKSTLLEAICLKCGIYIWEGMERRRFEINPHEKELHKAIAIQWNNGPVPGSFFASEIFRNFAQLLDEWAAADPKLLRYFGGRSLMTQSHGQSFMSFFKARYQIKGLYLLDEPETALSPKSQLGFLKLLHEMGLAGHAQFIVATHSPILMACPGAKIYSFDDIPVRQIDYNDTEHYRIYKAFMMNPSQYLR
jgi:predicted ATPase